MRRVACSQSELVNRLFEIARKRGLNQADMAKKIGTYHTSVNSWYCGRNVPKIKSVEEMAQALNVRIVLEEINDA